MSEKSPLVLVDGSSYLFRAFFALPPLKTSKGQPTGAVKGVISMIRSLIKAYPDSQIAVVFDAKGKTFRHETFPDYKANRPPMPEDLAAQIAPIHDIIKAMGLPLLMVEGVEADDVIGTLAEQAWQQKIKTLISTGDKDLAQLVNEHVSLLNTMSNESLDVPGVEAKFGLPPERIIDYLALMGDKVDNIPGVPGVGEKTAKKLLSDYGSLQGIIDQAESIKGKLGENIRHNLEQLLLSKELATIKLDVTLDFGPADLSVEEADKPQLMALFKKLEFRPWIKELEKEGVQAAAGEEEDEARDEDDLDAYLSPESVNYHCVTTEEALNACLAGLKQRELLALSVETDGEHYMEARIIGLSLCASPGEAYYFPLAHDYMGVGPQLDLESVLKSLSPLLEDKALFKAGHDLKHLTHILENYGIGLRGRRYDVMLQSYVLNSVAVRHSLDKLAEYYLGQDKSGLDELLGKGRNKLTYAQLDVEKATRHACENADYCLRLSQVLTKKLKATGKLAEVYRYFEIPLMPVLQGMERNGIKLDPKALGEQSGQLAVRMEELEKEAFELAGEEFNLGSPKQLQEIFYEKLKLPVISKTPKGQPSTAEPVLQELALDYPLPKVILEYRGLSKLKSTYTDKLPLQINPKTQRVHSIFQQAVAATGRLSSTEPNLQNIPIRTEAGRRIRKTFIADKGKCLVAADYSQVELRIMAHLSADAGLTKAFAEGLDVHRATAAEIFSVKLDEVSAEQRRSAKAINFGLIYGMSAFGLAKQLGIGRADAQEYVDRYFHRYPGVQDYMDKTRELASEKGFVETLFGRRLYLPDIKAGKGMLRRAAERTAINAPMQGTAADIIKRAMIDIGQWLKVARLDARMVLQVHDELVFEVAEKDVALLVEGVKFRMVSAAALKVPLVVDVGVGANWEEAH